MTTTLKTLTAAAALLAFAGTAEAEMRFTGQFGSWSTGTGTNDHGQRMCSAQLIGADRSIYVKYQANSSSLFLHLFKTGWNIPDGQPVTVVVQVDHAPTMMLSGIGMHHTQHESDGINIVVPNTAWAASGKPMDVELLGLIRDGLKIQFYFPDGNEESWDGQLTGSTNAVMSLAQCITALDGSLSPPAPPSVAPTQPFAAPQTQPFAAVPRNNL
jgi:hypothetical protein